MCWLRTDEGMKQNVLNFKSDENNKVRKQKLKARSGDGNWKSKFCKAIKTDQGLKLIISIMSTEEQMHKHLISELCASNRKPSMPSNQALISLLSL